MHQSESNEHSRGLECDSNCSFYEVMRELYPEKAQELGYLPGVAGGYILSRIILDSDTL